MTENQLKASGTTEFCNISVEKQLQCKKKQTFITGEDMRESYQQLWTGNL